MPDTRARVPLNGKAVDLSRLAVEAGADLTASDVEVVVADPESTVTVEQLKAAVDAHVPPPPPVDPSEDLAARLEALAGKQSPTVKDLIGALLGTDPSAVGAVAGRPTM